MAEQLNRLPTEIIAGESISIDTGISSTGSTLIYSFAAKVPFSVTCSAPSPATTWQLILTPVQTLQLGRGSIRFAGMKTNTTSGLVTAVDSGTISVTASPLAVSEYTAYLAAVTAALNAWGSNPNSRVKVGEIEINYKDKDDLISLQEYFRSQIALETGGTNATGIMRINTRFF
jgi:hypothetical protein